jgi:hypothetical protein
MAMSNAARQRRNRERLREQIPPGAARLPGDEEIREIARHLASWGFVDGWDPAERVVQEILRQLQQPEVAESQWEGRSFPTGSTESTASRRAKTSPRPRRQLTWPNEVTQTLPRCRFLVKNLLHLGLKEAIFPSSLKPLPLYLFGTHAAGSGRPKAAKR